MFFCDCKMISGNNKPFQTSKNTKTPDVTNVGIILGKYTFKKIFGSDNPSNRAVCKSCFGNISVLCLNKKTINGVVKETRQTEINLSNNLNSLNIMKVGIHITCGWTL